MKTKEIKFLEKLGYTIEVISYTFFEDGGRYCNDSYSTHEVRLAYKTETPEIKNFKSSKYKTQLAHNNWYIRDFILSEVYKREFEENLYNLVYNSL